MAQLSCMLTALHRTSNVAERDGDEPNAIPFLKRFTVFNTGQCEGLSANGAVAIRVGQKVSFDGRVGTYLKRSGVFTVTKLLPPVGSELQYRIKSDGESHERVASEHELQAVELNKPIVAAGPRAETEAARVFSGIS